jgi:L-aspartate oxidase
MRDRRCTHLDLKLGLTMNYSDFLVVGGGIAGLTFALEAAEKGSVTVLFKRAFTASSTSWAQGGVAAVQNKDDSKELHIQDTFTAGGGLCDDEIVRLVVDEGPERIRDLIARGVEFDKVKPSSKKAHRKEEYHLHQEGGHSRRRIFHSTDATGMEIQQKLIKAVQAHPNITLFEHTTAIDLITKRKLSHLASSSNSFTRRSNRVYGTYALVHYPDNQKAPVVEAFTAGNTLMATGGAGKVYLYTSNPDVATGDGIAMAYRAGTPVANMEFFQFHPTCLYNPSAKSFLITEAMRGEGAYLTRIDGFRFMPGYHPLAELAPRDVVARAIDHELKAHGDDFVFLDIRHRGADFIKTHFPTIFSTCLHYGLDITKNPIPVVPAAHFCCGGILTDKNGATDLLNLYAAGECAYTGLHGANRLASNSLLEGIVFGYRAAQHAISLFEESKLTPEEILAIPKWNTEGVCPSDEQVTIAQGWQEIRTFMWNYVGIVRSDKRLARALRRSCLIEQEIKEYYWNFDITSDLLELRNLSVLADLIIRSALLRKESRGLHFNLDYPNQDDIRSKKPTILVPKLT